MFYVYAIYNQANEKLYIGQTNNLDRRIGEHNNKLFNKGHFTAKFSGQWGLIYKEEFDSRSNAMVREKELKSHQGRVFLRKFIK